MDRSSPDRDRGKVIPIPGDLCSSAKLKHKVYLGFGIGTATKAIVNGQCCALQLGKEASAHSRGCHIGCSGDGSLAPLLMGPLKDFK